jgi:hypothetical protein
LEVVIRTETGGPGLDAETWGMRIFLIVGMEGYESTGLAPSNDARSSVRRLVAGQVTTVTVSDNIYAVDSLSGYRYKFIE